MMLAQLEAKAFEATEVGFCMRLMDAMMGDPFTTVKSLQRPTHVSESIQGAFICAPHGPAPQNGVLAIEQVGTEHVVLGLIMENTVAAARGGIRRSRKTTATWG